MVLYNLSSLQGDCGCGIRSTYRLPSTSSCETERYIGGLNVFLVN